MAAGYTYQTDFVRVTERERALKGVEKSHQLIAEKQTSMLKFVQNVIHFSPVSRS